LLQVHREAALAYSPDRLYGLVILDIMLPGINGSRLPRLLRRTPSRFSSDRAVARDILGLQLGADDYLPKPFVVEELVLRVRGILRRAEWARSPARTGPLVRVGASAVDITTMRADTSSGPVSLTEREVMLVRFFAENDGRVLTRGELLERVWGYTFDTSTRTLDTFVHRLRKHFEPDPRHPRHFHTVRGVGRFRCRVTRSGKMGAPPGFTTPAPRACRGRPSSRPVRRMEPEGKPAPPAVVDA
jgi:DNA-binding response OmpR family regulator